MAHAEAPVFGPTAAAILSLVGLTYTASVAGFIFARLALGFGEAGNFPAAIKVTAEWFPKKERALATGIFNSGTNIGALVTPLVVPWITLYWGWYWAFIITGALGLLWLFFWIPIYRAPERPSVGRRRRTRAHPQRSAGSTGPHPVAAAAAVPADLGVRARQVPHRPGVVAIPLLDPGFSQSQSRHRSRARSARRSSRSISSPTSAASAEGGCRRHCSSAAGA